MRFAPTRPRLLLAMLLLFAVIALILGVVLPPSDSSAAPVPVNSASVLLISEFDSDSSTLLAVQPDDPSQRRPLHVVQHAPGWDIVGTTSPDGQRLAYLVLPPQARDPQTETTLMLLENLDRASGPRARQLVQGVDMRGGVAWAADGASLFVRTTITDAAGRPTFELLEIDAADGRQRSLLRLGDVLGLYPVGRAAQGPTYAVSVGVNGSELLAIDTSASDLDPQRLPLSSEITRSWALSPDGSQLAFTDQQGVDLHVRVASLATDFEGLTVAAAVEERGLGALSGTASPAWHPDGSLSIGTFGQTQGGAPTLRVQAKGDGTTVDSERGAGFALPIVWSPLGSYLAVRDFSGLGPGAPGDETAAIIDSNGTSRPIRGKFVRILGWWSASG